MKRFLLFFLLLSSIVISQNYEDCFDIKITDLKDNEDMIKCAKFVSAQSKRFYTYDKNGNEIYVEKDRVKRIVFLRDKDGNNIFKPNISPPYILVRLELTDGLTGEFFLRTGGLSTPSIQGENKFGIIKIYYSTLKSIDLFH